MKQISRLGRRALFIFAILAAILLAGTVGFVLIDHFTIFDAFYLTLVTITTVGYSEIGTLSQSGRAFNVVIIITGVLALLLAMGTLTQTVLELELSNYFEKRRARRMIQKLENHFILCGYGRMGRGAARELASSKAPLIVSATIDPVEFQRASEIALNSIVHRFSSSSKSNGGKSPLESVQ